MITQRSQEWYSARIGKFTASGFSNLMAKPRDKYSEWSRSALNYIEKAAAQLYYNDYYVRPDSDSTRWGMRQEPYAIDEFKQQFFYEFMAGGFVTHPEIRDVGATPDLIITDDEGKKAIAQIKCPYNQENHKKYISKIVDTWTLKKSKSQYFWQVQGEIWVTGSDYGYFVSFDPRVLGENRLHYARIDRDDEAIEELKNKVIESLTKRDEVLYQFQNGIKQPKGLWEYWGG